jgi:hypothetical protein
MGAVGLADQVAEDDRAVAEHQVSRNGRSLDFW